ncbi:SDH family Clp fold serine proteinase [Mesorhizobium atlanticum]|uniref:Serine protease n=1 Tax=Mesorhizobium atlanticum TaxID=2233532 RepID=A0A330GSC7_9HYPH|nr:hypothetical protein [Mesorhizobium atlanticum]RAZ75806.1 hypothetical protein DPM35_13730 [Mesorhizobium atlanticum]
MAFAERKVIIEEIEKLRGSKVICYLTSVRPNLQASMAQDAVRVFFDHLRLLPERPAKKIDVFLCSNGGNGTVPWRLISLLREFSDVIGVILPYRAYSAATMLALGADEIVMHPFAEMGPIDPTVTNDFNPLDPQTNQRLGISVEDVKAYVSFVRDTVGIRHEDELVKAVEILSQKVHPLAIGNVERFISQSRMIARKILLTHMSEETSKHKIDEIIETLASKLYFHGHPINRKEARDLGLQVAENPQPQLEELIWQLYLDFEVEFKNSEAFDPVSELFASTPAPVPINPAAPPQNAGIPLGTSVVHDLKFAAVETARLSSSYDVKKRLVVYGHQSVFEPMIREESLKQGWTHTPAA